jgi:hypothetical protein
MSPVESPTIAALAEPAIAPFIWKKLTTNVTGEPADRDQRNLSIKFEIDVSNAVALFHSQDVEHVLDHKPRSVSFCADHDCILAFDNQLVFGCELVQLFANQKKVLPVKDDLTKVETGCDVYIMTPAVKGVMKATGRKKAEGLGTRRPPVIVVP